ncbi:hypothetical protein ACFFJI_04915 [Allobacillus sp. GCM10007491]|uniref:hypothetical protein n=1 Tax=Allobacillus TaxID=1400133 RepID=UPI003013524F
MICLFIEWVVIFLVGLILFWVIGWLTGDKTYGAKDDERSELIKHKAIVGSWTFIFAVFIINIIFDFFNLRTGPLKSFGQPELFYLIVLIGSYIVFYIINRRRLSSNEK